MLQLVLESLTLSTMLSNNCDNLSIDKTHNGSNLSIFNLYHIRGTFDLE